MALLLPINVLELFIRPLSLCMRLFGNTGAFVVMELIKLCIPVAIPVAFSAYFDVFDGLHTSITFLFSSAAVFLAEAIEMQINKRTKAWIQKNQKSFGVELGYPFKQTRDFCKRYRWKSVQMNKQAKVSEIKSGGKNYGNRIRSRISSINRAGAGIGIGLGNIQKAVESITTDSRKGITRPLLGCVLAEATAIYSFVNRTAYHSFPWK